MPTAFVLIVNYRTGPPLANYLASLVFKRPALQGGRVIVVDNAAGLDSVAQIGTTIDGRAATWPNTTHPNRSPFRPTPYQEFPDRQGRAAR